MFLKGNIKVINKALKKVNLSDSVLYYCLDYIPKCRVYEYKEYVVDKGDVHRLTKLDILSLAEVKHTLNDICGHYGTLDYVLYNDTIEIRDTVIGLHTDIL